MHSNGKTTAKREITRRDFIARSAVGAALLGGLAPPRIFGQGAGAIEPADAPTALTPREFLQGILYTKREIDDWLAGKAFPFSSYSSEFGWLLRNAVFQDGVDDSISVYTYSASGERLMINYRDQPCRINTYGNSFTQCHQVSDGETWQEVLAAHLREPVRNFGVGGWSVYQAYLRMRMEEARVPADCIILNIYEDDHFRNLDAWRNIRMPKNIQAINATLPHVTVNAKENRFEEHANPCPTPESLYRLCDLDSAMEMFRDDFALQVVLARINARARNPERSYADVLNLATTHGISTRIDTAGGLSEAADVLHHQAAYYSSQRIVEKIAALAQTRRQRVLYVLSYPVQYVARYLREGVRPDQPFVDFMARSGYPVVDLLAAHAADFAHYKGEVVDYLKQYYIGHYTPRGNFFTAFAIKDRLAALLDPRPRAYRPSPDIMKQPEKKPR